MQRAVRFTAEGDRSFHQQGGECEGGELFIGIGVRGLYVDGGSGMGGRQHGRRWESRGVGRGVVLGWRRLLVTTALFGLR